MEFAHEGLDVGAWRQGREEVGSARGGPQRWRDRSRTGRLKMHRLLFVKYPDQKGEVRANEGGEGDVHDVLLYKV